MNVLVTGANGFVGHYLCQDLVDAGFEVTGTVRRADHVSMLPRGVRGRVIEDIADHSWATTLDGIDAVIHLACRVHVTGVRAGNLDQYRATNVVGTKNIGVAAVDAGVKRFIYLSSIKVHGEWTSPGRPFRFDDELHPADGYGISKMQAEQALSSLTKATDVALTIVRPPLVYGANARGNLRRLSRLIKTGLPLPFAGIDNKRSLISLVNLTDFIVTCLQRQAPVSGTLLVSDGRSISTAELATLLAQAAGVPARQFALPAPIFAISRWLFGRTAAWTRLCGDLELDIQHTRDAVGWRPPFTVEESFDRMLAGQAGAT